MLNALKDEFEKELRYKNEDINELNREIEKKTEEVKHTLNILKDKENAARELSKQIENLRAKNGELGVIEKQVIIAVGETEASSVSRDELIRSVNLNMVTYNALERRMIDLQLLQIDNNYKDVKLTSSGFSAYWHIKNPEAKN